MRMRKWKVGDVGWKMGAGGKDTWGGNLENKGG